MAATTTLIATEFMVDGTMTATGYPRAFAQVCCDKQIHVRCILLAIFLLYWFLAQHRIADEAVALIYKVQ